MAGRPRTRAAGRAPGAGGSNRSGLRVWRDQVPRRSSASRSRLAGRRENYRAARSMSAQFQKHAYAEGAAQKVAVGGVCGKPCLRQHDWVGIKQICDVDEEFAPLVVPESIELERRVEVDVEHPRDRVVVGSWASRSFCGGAASGALARLAFD